MKFRLSVPLIKNRKRRAKAEHERRTKIEDKRKRTKKRIRQSSVCGLSG